MKIPVLIIYYKANILFRLQYIMAYFPQDANTQLYLTEVTVMLDGQKWNFHRFQLLNTIHTVFSSGRKLCSYLVYRILSNAVHKLTCGD